MCESGKAKETINHILRQCKLFEEFRVHMTDDLMKRKIFPLYCIKAILYYMLLEAVIPVAQCINSINKRIKLGRYYNKPNQGSKYAKTFCVKTELVYSYFKES
jgi:hypothetical protein